MAQEKNLIDPAFWRGRKVLLTGHTGFKGSWMTLLLEQMGAKITGVSLSPETDPALWNYLSPHIQCESHIADVNDFAKLKSIIQHAKPDICIHMAAQALVRRSYQFPRNTFATNIMGSVNLLESLVNVENLEAVLVVTSDKVYKNDDKNLAFTETHKLGGSDPYSASKAACEHIAHSYYESFFRPQNIPVATARGGNVIGGGDWSADRLVPDIYRAMLTGTSLELRYPHATRPWQHVLDCISGYLSFAQYLVQNKTSSVSTLNFSSQDANYPNVSELVETIGETMGAKTTWKQIETSMPEKPVLALDSSEARRVLGWDSRLTTTEAIQWTGEWYAAFHKGENAYALTHAQLQQYIETGK